MGIANGLFGLMLDTGWLAFSEDAYHRVEMERYLVDGIILGFIFSLIFSRQLTGTKRVDLESRHDAAV